MGKFYRAELKGFIEKYPIAMFSPHQLKPIPSGHGKQVRRAHVAARAAFAPLGTVTASPLGQIEYSALLFAKTLGNRCASQTMVTIHTDGMVSYMEQSCGPSLTLLSGKGSIILGTPPV